MLRVMRDDDGVWDTPFHGWQWAELGGLLTLVGVGAWVPDRATRVGLGVLGLVLLTHITIWLVPEIRRRY
jgi:hypothetical protein